MEEKTLIEATVVFPVREDGAVLLGKKVAKIGMGCWNGYGGGREAGETLEETAIRELYEESGMVAEAKNMEKIAILHAHNHKTDGRIVPCAVHFYVARHCTGEPTSTEEMATPTWFALADLPLAEMMPADALWVPAALAGKKLIVTVHYSPFQKEMLQPIEIEEVLAL